MRAGRPDGGRIRSHDDVNVQTDKFACQSRKALDFRIRRSNLNEDVLTIDVAVLLQPLPKGTEGCARFERFN